MAIDPKYLAEQQRLIEQAMATALAAGHTEWWKDGRLRTAEQLAAEDAARSTPRPAPAVPMSREQILTSKLAEAERERDRLARKLEKKARKVGR